MTKDAKHWLSGIAITVIGGLILWYLTKPSDPPKPQPTQYARVKIVDCNVPFTAVGAKAVGNITVYNEGNVLAEECEIWWESGNKDGISIVSQKFNLVPGEKRVIKMFSVRYTKAGRYSTMLNVYYKYDTPAEPAQENVSIGSKQFPCQVVVKQRYAAEPY